MTTYSQHVADELRKLITEGDIAVGDRIPSTAKLCARYAVSVTVVRAAVAQLRAEGVVQGQPGKGVYVIATPQAVARDRVGLDDVMAELTRLRDEIAELRDLIETCR